MKVENFIDCVYQNNNLSELKIAIVNTLPCNELSKLSSVLIVDMDNTYYAIKIRWCETENGKFSLYKTHQKIKCADFKVVTKEDYKGLNYLEMTMKTRELTYDNRCIVYKMSDYEIKRMK